MRVYFLKILIDSDDDSTRLIYFLGVDVDMREINWSSRIGNRVLISFSRWFFFLSNLKKKISKYSHSVRSWISFEKFFQTTKISYSWYMVFLVKFNIKNKEFVIFSIFWNSFQIFTSSCLEEIKNILSSDWYYHYRKNSNRSDRVIYDGK